MAVVESGVLPAAVVTPFGLVLKGLLAEGIVDRVLEAGVGVAVPQRPVQAGLPSICAVLAAGQRIAKTIFLPSYETSGSDASPLPCVKRAVTLCSAALGDDVEVDEVFCLGNCALGPSGTVRTDEGGSWTFGLTATPLDEGAAATVAWWKTQVAE